MLKRWRSASVASRTSVLLLLTEVCMFFHVVTLYQSLPTGSVVDSSTFYLEPDPDVKLKINAFSV